MRTKKETKKLLQNLMAWNNNHILFLSILQVNWAIPVLFLPGLPHMTTFSQSISWAGIFKIDSLMFDNGADYWVRCLGSSPHGLTFSSNLDWLFYLMTWGQDSKKAKEDPSGTFETYDTKHTQCHFYHIIFFKGR